MGIKKYLLSIFFIAVIYAANAQVAAVQSVDTATQLYNSGDWKQLIGFGNKALANGIDSAGLRLRIAYAYFITGDYKKSLYQYNKVLLSDPYNSTARYYAYFCNKYLDNNVLASYNAAYLAKSTVNGWIAPFGLVDMGFESGVKENNDANRDNSYYNRIGLTERLGWRLQLEQSVAYFSQEIFRITKDYSKRDDREVAETTDFTDLADNQKEYYAKLSFAVTNDLAAIGSYHYLDTRFINTIYNNNLGLLGLKYTGTYADLQADANFGNLDGKQVQQYDGKLILYPLGNFNLYAISTASAVHLYPAYHYIFDQVLGFKLLKNTWMETDVTFGDQDDYLTLDGLYVYNSIDNTTFKCGGTVFYELGKHAQVQLNYTYEKKYDEDANLKYDQNSTTLGLLWKF